MTKALSWFWVIVALVFAAAWNDPFMTGLFCFMGGVLFLDAWNKTLRGGE